MSKKCSKCQKSKPLSEFAKNKSKKDGLSVNCRECKSAYNKAHYSGNKGYYVEKAERNKAPLIEAAQKIINEAKSVPCTDCHRSYPPYVMDFDHLDPNEKEFNISAIRSNVYSIKGLTRLKAEIAKCEVVCANCHRERTHGLSSGSGTEAPNLG